MWTVVYIAPSRAAAEEIKGFLERDGVLAAIRPVNVGGDADQVLFESEANYEVLVSEAEVEEAQELVSAALQKAPN